jgi:hypothetical protein
MTTYEIRDNIHELREYENRRVDILNIKKRLNNISYNTAFNTVCSLFLLSLVLGIYLGGYIITGNISKSLIKAKSEIHIFSSEIGDIAQAAELLVNICNNPGIAPFCKNDTII